MALYSLSHHITYTLCLLSNIYIVFLIICTQAIHLKVFKRIASLVVRISVAPQL